MNTCINFKIRHKQYRKYFYCSENKKVISLDDCKNCSKRILKRNKPIKKVSKKRKYVSQKTYDNVYDVCAGQCQICYTIKNLELHHILYRSERQDLVDDASNCIMLCADCHKLVHSDKHYWQPILIDKRKKLKK